MSLNVDAELMIHPVKFGVLVLDTLSFPRQELLDFDPELQCGECWENIPLEFHWLTINCLQSYVW